MLFHWVETNNLDLKATHKLRDKQPIGKLEFVYQQFHLGRMRYFVEGKDSLISLTESVDDLALDSMLQSQAA